MNGGVLIWPRFNFPQLTVVLPLLFALHCAEEFTRFLPFARRFHIDLPLADNLQLLLAMVALELVILTASLLASRALVLDDGRLFVWYVVFASMYSHALLNVAGALWLGVYAPGAIVAGTLYLPFGIYMAIRALREGWLNGSRLILVVIAGMVSYVGLVIATLALGRALGAG